MKCVIFAKEGLYENEQLNEQTFYKELRVEYLKEATVEVEGSSLYTLARGTMAKVSVTVALDQTASHHNLLFRHFQKHQFLLFQWQNQQDRLFNTFIYGNKTYPTIIFGGKLCCWARC